MYAAPYFVQDDVLQIYIAFVLSQDFIQEFIETATTFRELFPKGEKRLLEAATKFFDKYDKEVPSCSQ
jgi:hypothetical protein